MEVVSLVGFWPLRTERAALRSWILLGEVFKGKRGKGAYVVGYLLGEHVVVAFVGDIGKVVAVVANDTAILALDVVTHGMSAEYT